MTAGKYRLYCLPALYIPSRSLESNEAAGERGSGGLFMFVGIADKLVANIGAGQRARLFCFNHRCVRRKFAFDDFSVQVGATFAELTQGTLARRATRTAGVYIINTCLSLRCLIYQIDGFIIFRAWRDETPVRRRTSAIVEATRAWA